MFVHVDQGDVKDFRNVSSHAHPHGMARLSSAFLMESRVYGPHCLALHALVRLSIYCTYNGSIAGKDQLPSIISGRGLYMRIA